jgi:hypothetical protein
MRKRPRRVRESKQENNLSPPMRARRRSAVLACPSPSDVEDTAKRFPPFEAWPEIEQVNRFCVLPTASVLYYPKPSLTFIKALKGSDNQIKDLMANYINIFPFLKPYRAQLFPMIREVYQSQFGTELPETFEEAVAYNRYDVVRIFYVLVQYITNHQKQSVKLEWDKILAESLGLMNEFSIKHETMHLLSINIKRPVTEEFEERTKALFALLWQQIGTGTQSGFWDKFNELNDKLMECISVQLALEEMRATLFAFVSILSETRQKIIDEVYPENREDREAQIFRKLRSLTGDRWDFALGLTMLVEYLNPPDPQSELEKLLCELNDKKAFTWSDKCWDNWLLSKTAFKEFADFFENNNDMIGKFMYPTATIHPLPSNKTMIVCNNSLRILVFTESMRQQLANPDLIHRLICPFTGQSPTCCGFGNNLRGIWNGIPKEYRGGLTPPVSDCLKQN